MTTEILTIETVLPLVLLVAYAAFALRRLMTYLHVLQQDDYSNIRLAKWIIKYTVFDKRLSAMLATIGIAHSLTALPAIMTESLLIAAFAFIVFFEKDPRKQSKKKLVLTPRATRVLLASFMPAFAAGTAVTLMPYFPWLWIAAVQLMPVFLIIGNLALKPLEAFIQKGYWNEAHEKLLDLNPKVIGITGSFGKTSIKHILGHILKMNAPTLITPGSVNTPMGITRIIREQLDASHRFFVVEMGAYGPGSIARLCRLAPPDMGIIASIGRAHYERFKSLETVARAKFELAQAVIEKDGKIIVHESTLRHDYSRKMKTDHPKHFIVCGSAEDGVRLVKGDVHITHLAQTAKGLEVHIVWNGETHEINAPLYGLHHGHNIALAFAAARELGIEADAILAALKRVPQIEHRLEVKPMADGTTIIDDAFNSNPTGFRSGLEVLEILTANGKGRAILITPGMVELGDSHDEEHEKVGALAGKICDIAIVVTPERIPSFIRGFRSTSTTAELIEMPTFQDAALWLESHKKPGDVILLENDLPDLYERIPKI